MPNAAPNKTDKDRLRPPSGKSASSHAATKTAAITVAADTRRRVLTQVLPHTVPDGLLIGDPTLLPYSVHEPS
ncbi:hypothetical protein G6F35_018663 [Rhizopus arrhizus]|nr:hypothetical protein G6F35_018663 [Rhizopus arrhizus]KAG1222895.1 hypothetical protein G6F68_020507 [Rhizopus microsporus]